MSEQELICGDCLIEMPKIESGRVDMVLTDPRRAQVLLRCTQEIITNSVRHAQASNLWIKVHSGTDGLKLSARDDGRGVSQLRTGNGLDGMSERLRQLGGKLEIESKPGAGFALYAWLPLEART